ncbi:ABC transporter ATP-binding protein [Acetobacter syzygii]|uniref:amino acid ABC transporter ATP-binding protein n=1 Tax=Acetobacter syzygii TaxID=146476 RepID=UPI0005DDC785|nr:amino acid ABC transporter ATP-binding protein [Acetobacter syzygii]GAN70155.1 ABC transporter polar amino acid permease [Acetobacter syzygii]GBR66324.1 amino acid transporter ATP-binding protein [Acetobacter syzygii NRIC 0483]GEL57113.1 ABC transporter ATP-binding protein [Acetobacter syzygii]
MTQASAPVLHLEQVYKSYGETAVLRGVDLKVFQGDAVFLIGPSGGGKSTLLRCINFLEYPDAGTITALGEKLCNQNRTHFEIASEKTLRHARARMPMVFQQFNLFSHQTVLENVIEGLITVKKIPKREAIILARTALDRVHMLQKQNHYPDQLSGGQKQRVAIARALAMDPPVILFDEPTSALDPELVSGVQTIIQDLSSQGLTLLVVTHDPAFVQSTAHTVCFCGDGYILESGTVNEIYGNPRTERVRKFIQSSGAHLT